MGARIKSREVGFRAGAVIQACAKYASVLIGLVVTMVLARLLAPAQFGVVAVVSVFLGLFTLLSNVGINAAVIQYRDLREEDCSALLSFTLLLGVGLSALFCLVSLPVSLLYDDPVYVPLMCVASPGVLLNAANMVPDGLLVRDKKFLAIGIRTIVSAVVGGAAGIALALAGWGAYALVLNTVASSLIVLLWNLATSGLRFGNWHFSEQLRLVGRFSGYQFASQFIQYMVRNLDNLLVGFVMGPVALGFYDKAYRLAKYPVDYVPATINQVLKSYFSSLQDDRDALYAAFVRVQKGLSIIGTFASVFCACAAEELVLLFFGPQWGESVLPFRILALSIVFQTVNFTVFSVLEGLKRTDCLLRHTAINACVMICLLVAGLASRNLAVVAACVAAAFAISSVPFVHYVVRVGFGRAAGPYVRAFAPEVVAAAALGAVYALAWPCMPGDLVLSLLLKLAIGLVVYGAAMVAMGQHKHLLFLLRRKKRRRGQSGRRPGGDGADA